MKYRYLVLLLFFLVLPKIASAASLSLSVDKTALENDSRADITIFLTASGERINALGGELVIISGDASFSEIQDGQSIVSAWVEGPKIKDNTVVFSGIIPGGFAGLYSPSAQGPQPGVLMKVSLRVKNPNNVVIGLKNIEAYVDNGEPVAVKLEPTELPINFSKISNTAVLSRQDASDPIFSSTEVIAIPGAADSFYVSFMAEDAESGIDHYEVQESLSPEINPEAWHRAENPYRLEDQTRRSYISIRAVNRAGKATVTTIPPVAQRNLPWLYFAIGLIALCAIVYGIYRYRAQKV